MGTCFGRCFSPNSTRHDRCSSIYRFKGEYVQFGENQNTRQNDSSILNFSQRLTSLLSIRKKAPHDGVNLELVENPSSYPYHDGCVAKLHLPCDHHFGHKVMQSGKEFQALDAKALLEPQSCRGPRITHENKSLNSTPPSSIDLEWEHEAYLNQHRPKDEEDDSDSAGISLNNNFISRRYYKSIPRSSLGSRQGSVTLDTSIGSKEGSRITTPDSLEWDFVDSSIPTLDQETEQLIAEIERLAANALEETGNYNFEDSREILDSEIS